MNLHQLLVTLLEKKAESLHLTTGSPPQLKLGDEWVPLKTPPLTPVETKELLYCVLTEPQKDDFERAGMLHFSFGVKDLSRFLVFGFTQRGACVATFWPVPFRIPEPPAWVANTVSMLAPGPGLLLVAGPKRPMVSTVLAWWVDHLNRTRLAHVVSLEQPITLLHPHKQCMVDQVEVPADVGRDHLSQFTLAGADVVSVDVDEGLPLAVRALNEGGLVLCALRAPTLDAASGLVKAVVPAHLASLVRGLVFVDASGAATVLDGASVIR